MTSAVVEEVQIYSKTKKQILTASRDSGQWIIDQSSYKDTFARRKDFNGLSIKALFDNIEPFGYLDEQGRFVGYQGQIGTLIAQKLNLTLEMIPIQSSGIKLENGSFTGSIKALQENTVDIDGANSFYH